MSNFGRKATLAAVAFAMVGSTVFGGAALASDDEDHGKHVKVTNTGGPGGAGGPAQSQCLIPIALSLGAVLGFGGDVTANQCNATGGAGGAGGAGLG
jgi:hypothetical protein